MCKIEICVNFCVSWCLWIELSKLITIYTIVYELSEGHAYIWCQFWNYTDNEKCGILFVRIFVQWLSYKRCFQTDNLREESDALREETRQYQVETLTMKEDTLRLTTTAVNGTLGLYRAETLISSSFEKYVWKVMTNRST